MCVVKSSVDFQYSQMLKSHFAEWSIVTQASPLPYGGKGLVD